MRRVLVVGSSNVDTVLRLADPLQVGETQLCQSTATHTGGKGANQAVAASLLGANVTFISALGDDAEGRLMRSALVTAGISDASCVTVAADTGKAYILSAASGDNSIVVVPGANSHLEPKHLQAIDGLRPGDVVVAQLEVPVPTVEAAFRSAKNHGATTILNAAPVTDIDTLISLVDILVVNETEAHQLSHQEPGAPVGQLMEALHARGLPNVVMTLGADGAAFSYGTDTITIPSQPVRVKDTTGAGDTFVGALAAALSRELPFAEGLKYATCAGALACTKLGAQEGMPTSHELDTFLTQPQPL